MAPTASPPSTLVRTAPLEVAVACAAMVMTGDAAFDVPLIDAEKGAALATTAAFAGTADVVVAAFGRETVTADSVANSFLRGSEITAGARIEASDADGIAAEIACCDDAPSPATVFGVADPPARSGAS